MKNENRNLIKIRLSNYRSIKPFWANIDDVNSGFRELNEFIKEYIHQNDHLDIRDRHHLIFFHQLPAYKVDGYSFKTRTIMKPPYTGIQKSRFYRKRYNNKRYLVNTKTEYWAKNGIVPIPVLKVIDNSRKLNDPSGINYLRKSQIVKILANTCFGVFYNNTLAYARMNGYNIHLHLDCVMEDDTHEYMMNVSAADMLRTMYTYYQYGISTIATRKKILRHLSNSTFGFLSQHLTAYTSFTDDIISNYEYGKIIISYDDNEYHYWKEIPLMVKYQQYKVITEIENFIKESNIDFSTTTLNVTFKSDVISKEANTNANS